MILAFLIINNFGKPRLLKFYEQTVRLCRLNLAARSLSVLFFASQPEQKQQQIVRELFATLTARSETASSFVDAAAWFDVPGARIIYRTYATLHFCVVIDGSESELGILDLIQVLVETLDRHFKNVCELDIIFNSPQVCTRVSHRSKIGWTTCAPHSRAGSLGRGRDDCRRSRGRDEPQRDTRGDRSAGAPRAATE